MNDKTKKYLADIQQAILHIEDFTKEISSFFDYESNLLIRRAVERELEIIGEAMNRILNSDTTVTIEHARRIVDLRNRVIHGYDKVDDGVIWSILKKYIPNLKKEVNDLLAEN